MKVIFLVSILLFTSCGRKRDDVNVQKDKESVAKIQSHLDYDPNSFRNVYLNLKINDLQFLTKNNGQEEVAEVALYTIHSKEPLYFSGYFPQGAYSANLEMVSGSSNISIQIKCLDDECSKALVYAQEQQVESVDTNQKAGIYPVLFEKTNGLWIKKWNPENYSTNKRELNGEDLNLHRDLELKKTVNLFVNFDDISENLGIIDQFREVPQTRQASEYLISKCEEELNGMFIRKTLSTYIKGFWASLTRFSLNTMEFEYDDFVYGECVISENTQWDNLKIFGQGPTYETALKEAVQHCTNNLRGVPTQDYNREIHRVGNKDSNNWIAKIMCSSIKGDKYTRI